MSTMGTLLRLALAATLCYVVYSKMTIIDTPEELKTCFDQPRFNTKETDPRLDNIHQYCIQKFRWHLQNNNPNITHETTHWIDELLRMANKEARKKRQAGAERRRKEIRRATDKERTDFFRAINLLKRDTVSCMFRISYQFTGWSKVIQKTLKTLKRNHIIYWKLIYFLGCQTEPFWRLGSAPSAERGRRPSRCCFPLLPQSSPLNVSYSLI